MKKENEKENLYDIFDRIKNGHDKDVNQENANNDGFTVPGYKGIFTNVMLEEVAEKMLDDDVLQKFKEGEIHIHDFNSYALGTLTCLQIPLDKALSQFGATDIRGALDIASIVMNVNQTQMHGGQAFANFDFDLAPYVEKTYIKYYEKFIDMSFKTMKISNVEITEEIDKKIKEQCHIDALDKAKDETFEAMKKFILDLNELKIRDGQGVFASLNFGLDTSVYGQIVSESILKAQIVGVNNGLTPNFPILIFKASKDLNFFPGTPNYFLYELSLECLSKRLFPNFQFIDSEFNINPHSDDPRDTISTMGCVDGDEIVEVKIGADSDVEFYTFKDLYAKLNEEEQEWEENKNTKFKKLANVFVRDINGDFTRAKGIIKNKDAGNWYRLSFSDGSDVLATADHPFVTIGGHGHERKYVEHILNGDMIPTLYGGTVSVTKKSFVGFLNLDSYDFTTESDTFVFSGFCSHNCRTRV